ncbi:MAG: hypothetical protein Q9193_006372 [Seirophora villosa]
MAAVQRSFKRFGPVQKRLQSIQELQEDNAGRQVSLDELQKGLVDIRNQNEGLDQHIQELEQTCHVEEQMSRKKEQERIGKHRESLEEKDIRVADSSQADKMTSEGASKERFLETKEEVDKKLMRLDPRTGQAEARFY